MPKKKPEQITVDITPNAPSPQTTDASVNSFADAPELSPSNSPVISNPASAGEKSHTKARHYRVTNSDVYYKGKAYPEGSIVDFQDEHLSKYLIPIDENSISPIDIVYDTITEPVSIDTSLDPKYVASRRRGRPRQL